MRYAHVGTNGCGTMGSGALKWLVTSWCVLTYCFGCFTFHGHPLTKHLVTGIFHLFFLTSHRNSHGTAAPVSVLRPRLPSAGHTELEHWHMSCLSVWEAGMEAVGRNVTATPDVPMEQTAVLHSEPYDKSPHWQLYEVFLSYAVRAKCKDSSSTGVKSKHL